MNKGLGRGPPCRWSSLLRQDERSYGVDGISPPCTIPKHQAGESVNNVFGYTWNPVNRLLSCGGSSGGEGALIGARGSILGVGTDIGMVSRHFIY